MVHILHKTDLDAFCTNLLSALAEKKIHLVLLEGDLGAGKTTLTQSLAKYLHVTEDVISPTFVLMKQYSVSHAFFTKLVHIDAYRVEDNSLFKTLHLDQILRNESMLCCVEWPNLIPELSSYPRCHIILEHTANPEKRAVHITYHE